MQKPEFDSPISILDSNRIPLTDYALSDVLEWVANVSRVMGHPRAMLMSDEIYDLICRHPMISQGIRDKIILTKCRALYFLTLDIIILADSTVMDCRDIKKEYSQKV